MSAIQCIDASTYMNAHAAVPGRTRVSHVRGEPFAVAPHELVTSQPATKGRRAGFQNGSTTSPLLSQLSERTSSSATIRHFPRRGIDHTERVRKLFFDCI